MYSHEWQITRLQDLIAYASWSDDTCQDIINKALLQEAVHYHALPRASSKPNGQKQQTEQQPVLEKLWISRFNSYLTAVTTTCCFPKKGMKPKKS